MNIPAFPQLPYESSRPKYEHEQGMTYRQYLIAHAPAEPQPWFQPKMRSEPRPPQDPQDVDRTSKFIGYRSREAEGQAFRMARTEYIRQKAQYDEDLKKQRYVQWPAAWADEVIAASAINCTT